VDIIKHPCEVAGKSTAVHAAILAPHDVTIYQFPDIPDYTNLMQVIIIYAHLTFASYAALFFTTITKPFYSQLLFLLSLIAGQKIFCFSHNLGYMGWSKTQTTSSFSITHSD